MSTRRGNIALRIACIGLTVIGCVLPHAAQSAPPLPVPCLAGACGSSVPSFVQFGSATAAAAGKTMTITQSSAQAVLNWANFNIASGYTVNVRQPSASAALLNNIWSADPSHIAGALNANGQVYLYNQNGILFDGGAQINVGGLTASTLQLSPSLFENGILSGNAALAGTGTLPPIFQAAVGPGGTPTAAGITVAPGASLNASDGGRIVLLGSAVLNQGTITAPDGQVILGAGNTVYLAASNDPSLRGLLIEVTAGGAASTVSNQGVISTPRGNVTLAGLVVNQAGQISATTSVSANGSIYLLAGDASNIDEPGFYNESAGSFGGLLPNNGGTVTLASGSVTQVLPDTTSAASITEQNLPSFIPSEVDLAGQSVILEGTAQVHAPGAIVNLYAATNPFNLVTNPGTATNDGGRIYLDSGSSIDVSGLSAVPVPATANILQVTLEGGDLQDDPLLRSGFLHGQSVTVNATQGSTLFNVTPYAGNIAVGIDQVLTTAGTIQLNSDGDVIARAGSSLNVSGGSVAYQGAFGPSTTKLLAANGHVYDISDAPNSLQYIGLANGYSYTDPNWGTATRNAPQTYYPAYTQGADAGQIDILAPQIYLRGSLTAQTVSGEFQRTPSTLPQGGALTLGCFCANSAGDPDYRAPGVVFMDYATDTLGDFAYADLNTTLPGDLQAVTTLSPTQLAQSGFNRFTLYSNGPVSLPAGTTLNAGAGGALFVTSDQSIAIDGDITAPGGTVSLTTTPQFPVDVAFHDISLGAGAVLDVNGNWTNDSPLVTTGVPTAPIAINGGSVALVADGSVTLGAGSRVDVSGGGWVNSSNKLNAGNAGGITLSASHAEGTDTPDDGTIVLGADARLIGDALSGGAGGVLAITSGSITVGWTALNTPGELLLSPEFFSNTGFSSYSLTGQSGVVIGSPSADGGQPVTIAPVEENLVFSRDILLEPTGSSVEGFATLATLPRSQRSPVNLTFTTTQSAGALGAADDGSVVLGQDASILAEPGATSGANVSLVVKGSTGSITVLGSIVAPAGDISLAIENPNFIASPGGGLGYLADQQILLGSQAMLAAPAYAQINTLDAQGYRQGSVLAAGSISLQAYKGYVVTDPGSVIDVSGTAGVLDIPTSNGVTPTVVAGNAGTISIDAREGLVLQGALLGEPAVYQGAAVSGAAGGTLNLGLDLYDYGTTNNGDLNVPNPFPLAARTLTLSSQSASALGSALQSGTAQISAGIIGTGGFDNITLKSADLIAIDGNVSLATRASVTLDAPLLQGDAAASLQLSSGHVSLGNYFNAADYFDTSASGYSSANQNPNAATVLAPACASAGACTATLTVNAQLIDIRGISGFSGFSSETLTSSGDLRLGMAQNPVNTPPPLQTPAGDSSNATTRAALSASGAMTLQAQQVYPTTDTDFTITSTSAVTVLPVAGAAATPLSAGGTLTINAPTITQSGVLRAPLGTITLQGLDSMGATSGTSVPGTVTLTAGSVTSVSADGLVIPFGATVNGQQWTYSPDALITQVIAAPPAKTIALNGASVEVRPGATVDLSGGGDLYAYEWIAGPGGSKDVLAPGNTPASSAYTYAILPTNGSAFAPIDAQYAQGSFANANQTISLSGVPGLAAGTYALLPARYALLPGAFAVQLIKSNSDLQAGPAIAQSDGAYEVAGKFGVAGTGVLDSRTSTFLIAPNSVVNTQSQYTATYGDAFFSTAAAANGTAVPSLPADAGALQISATASLALNGKIDFATSSFVSGTTSSGTPVTVQGVGGDVSIQAPQVVIVDSATPSNTGAGALQLDAQSLDNLGAQSLVLGASVQYTTAGEQITAGPTQSIELDNASVALTAPEIILVAQNQISFDPGARLGTSGTLTQAPESLVLAGGGALLRASSGAPVPLIVDAAVAQNPGGQLSIGAQASLTATGSLLLYSTGNSTAQPSAVISAPGLDLYSSRVSLGDVPTGAAAPTGLNLTTQLLAQLTGLTELTIGSTSTIDFYGAVSLGAPNGSSPALSGITLDAWSLDGYGSGNSLLQAGAITLVNSNPVSSQPAPLYSTAPNGTGTLTLRASAFGPSDSGQISIGQGVKAILGFSAVNLDADGDIQGQGTGTLTLSNPGGSPVPLVLQGAALSAASASSQAITTTGAVSIGAAAASSAVVPSAPLGGALAITGASIAQNGFITLPAGILTLHATSGDVLLGPGSLSSAAGASQGFVVTNAVAAGGQISLLADQGNVTLTPGATLDVSGATSPDGKTSGNAGSLDIAAPLGQFTFAGSTLKGMAAAGQSQGHFTLDVNSGLGGSGGTSLDALASVLAGSGFTGAVAVRSRSDPLLTLTGSVTASSFQLSADQGAIDIAGSINTSGGSGSALQQDGGAIALWAGAGLNLLPGAQLLANAGATGPVGVNGTAAAAHGGGITLGTTSGAIDLQAGSTLQLAGSDANSDGTLTLRAPTIDGGEDVAVTAIASTLAGTNSSVNVIVEGVNLYSMAGGVSASGAPIAATLGTNADALLNPSAAYSAVNNPYTNLSIGTSGVLFADANTLLMNSAAVSNRLMGTYQAAHGGQSTGLNLTLRPGIEVDSGGDLRVADASTPVWDLDSWNAALGAPVNLTLRAAGNLIFNGSLSDGFTDTGGPASSWSFGESAAGIDSASYRLTAGADLSAANPLAVVPQAVTGAGATGAPNSGNLILVPGTLIRTGDGNIDLTAGGDVLLGFSYQYHGAALAVTEHDPLSSVIYTAGVPSTLSAAQAAVFNLPTDDASYPTGGGNITVSAADDLLSAPSAQLATAWLWRQGATEVNADGSVSILNDTSWWIEFSNFEQGIGALGGGNIALSAGRNITNVSAVIPTTGILAQAQGDVPDLSNLVLTGGGQLQVQAGGDVASGVFEDDWGNAVISAGGALDSGTTLGNEIPNAKVLTALSTPILPVLLLGSGTFDVDARTGAELNLVGNSTTLPELATNLRATGRSYFYTYTPTTSLTVVSAGGNVVLDNDSKNLPVVLLNLNDTQAPKTYDNPKYPVIYPGTLSVAALSGDIDVLGSGVSLFPSASGNLALLAEGNITGSLTTSASGPPNLTTSFALTLYETDPNAWSNVLAPQQTPAIANKSLLPLLPLHQDDPQPIDIVARTGSIATSTMNFPKAADVIAGGDIQDLTYSGKNLNPDDVTLIAAGGQISYSTPTEPITNALLPNGAGISLGGPGYLEVLAGGTMNLGDGNGIVTTGSLNDARLSPVGAGIVVGAGFGTTSDGSLRQPAVDAFIDAYLAPDASGDPSLYSGALVGYMQQLSPLADASIGYGAALAGFRLLSAAQQLPLIAQVLSDELSATGLAHTLQGTSYARGYQAISTLFPTSDPQGNALSYQGDIDMFFSQIKSEQGGDINLLAPGGSVLVGVPNPPSGLATLKQSFFPPVAAAANLGVLVLDQGAIEGFADDSFEVNTSRVLTLEGGDIILWASNGNIDAGRGAKSASAAPPPVIQTSANGNVIVNPINDISGSGIGQLLTGPGETAGLVNLIAPKGAVNAGDAGIRVAGNLNIAAVQVIGAGNITVTGTATGVPVSEAGALSGALAGANALGDASKSAVSELSQDLANASNYQQLTESLQPSFIVVKMFCLGVECETQ